MEYLHEPFTEISEYVSNSLESTLERYRGETVLALDFETRGLSPYRGGSLVSLALCSDKHETFLNFNPLFSPYIPEADYQIFLQRLLVDEAPDDRVLIGHNLKFDLSWLYAMDIKPKGTYWCTQVMARVEYNDHLAYNLDECAKRIGEKKSDVVKEYCMKNKLWEWELVPGKKARKKVIHFHQVPPPVIAPYNLQDARVALKLYHSQKKNLEQWLPGPRGIAPIVEMESKVTRILTEMEDRGILIDMDYVREAIRTLTEEREAHKATFKELTGREFVDSNKANREVFDVFGISYGKTEKGNPSFTDAILEKIDHPIARCILSIRSQDKLLGTFFSSFAYFVGKDSAIRASFRQGGTATGRFSCSDPNLQQLPNPERDVGRVPARRAFKARDGASLLSIDFAQMEFRVMLDYAGCRTAIQRILDGQDVHSATASMVGIDRKLAKTLNFALLYGAGPAKLASQLGVTVNKARQLRDKFFSAMPEILWLIYGGGGQRGIVNVAASRGYIINKFGRRYFFSDRGRSYVAPNHLIQGTCSDVVRNALIAVSSHIERHKLKSRLLLQIHDELVFELYHGEEWAVEEWKLLMGRAYPHKLLPLTVSAEIGPNLYDMEEFSWPSNPKPSSTPE